MAGRHPQVFMVNGGVGGGGGHRRAAPPPPPPTPPHHNHPPPPPQQYLPRMEPQELGIGGLGGLGGMAPCWTFPPARQNRRWCSNSSLVTVLVMLLALVFAALGLGAFQIQRLKDEMKELTKETDGSAQSISPQGQIGFREDFYEHKAMKTERHAAHLTVNTHHPPSQKTLQWESHHAPAFTKGVLYHDGSLQINHTSLYFVYSRVEILGNDCEKKNTKSFLHTVFMRRKGSLKDTVLMEGHKEGFCNSHRKQETSVKGGGQVWTLESYLGAVLELKEGDWIYVNMSHPHLISTGSPAGIYFGLYQTV